MPLTSFFLQRSICKELILFCALCFTTGLWGQYTIDVTGDYAPEYYNEIPVNLGSDQLSTALPIGFNFNFFGNIYSQFYVSSDGYITFNGAGGNGNGEQMLPDPNNPNAVIAACWSSVATDYIYISYETVGFSPNRKLHVDFYMEDFGSVCPGGNELASQIILYESNHSIEIHTSWTGDNCATPATQGIENANGSQAFYLPGRNNAVWNVDEDFVRFTPDHISDVRILSMASTTCTGAQNIGLWFQNRSNFTMDTFHFDWEWQGVSQNAVDFYSPVAPNESALVILGQQNMSAGPPVSLKVWSYNPDNEVDQDHSNDTLSGLVYAGLSGVKTIGGTSPDYATISDAVTALEAAGVCDSVIFSIRSGTYNESIDIDFFTYLGDGIVVFRSETGNADDVIITQAYNSAGTNRLIDIYNAHNLRFRNLTCKVTGSACANVFYASSYCYDIRIENCNVLGSVCNSTSFTGAAIVFTNGYAEEWRLTNNIIRKGSYGIYVTPGSNNYADFPLISGNDIDSCYKYGVYLNRVYGMQMHHNDIFCPLSGAIGMEVFGFSGNTDIYANKIQVDAGLAGCRISDYNNTSGNDFLWVYNNMFHLGGSVANSIAFSLSNSNRINIWHNTFNSISSVTSGLGLFAVSLGQADFKNNITTNLGAGRAANFQNLTTDYNVFYSINTPLLTSIVNYNTLTDWQTASGQDLHSLQLHPMYSGPTDLHIKNASLNGTATLLNPSITFDFDDQVRNSTLPEIGADEIGFLADDIGSTGILFSNNQISGSNNLEAIVSNIGINAVNTYTLQWSVNNVLQAPVMVSTPIASSLRDTISLGSVNLVPGQSYSIKVYSQIPNGNPDADVSNDTTQTGVFYPRLRGTYTVGGTTPDFASLTSGINALQLGGIIDSVSFAIRDGFYSEALTLNTPGAYSCAKPVHIYSQSGNAGSVVFNNNLQVSPTVRLNNVSGVRFSNITFGLTASAFHNVVIIENGATCNSFSGCVFNGRNTNQTTTTYATVLGNSNQGINNDYFNCTFVNGSYGLYTNGPTASLNTQLEVIGNTFLNNFQGGLAVINSDRALIRRNTATVNTTVGSGYSGIFGQESHWLEVSYNQVSNVSGGANGILITECDGSAGDSTRMFNNYVYSNSTQGLGVGYSNYTNVYNNTSRSLAGRASVFYWSSYFKIRNNIFVSVNAPAIELLNMGTAYTSNYNCLYSPTSNLGEFENTQIATLAGWQALGFDAASINTDPQFLGTTYHPRSVFLDSAGTSTVFVTTDIEGDIRPLNRPDIGADEFVPSSNDAGILSILHPSMPFVTGSNPVYMEFINNGSDTLNSLEFHWQVNGVTQTPFGWTGILPKAVTYDSLEIGTYSFLPYIPYTVKVWLHQPNGIADQQHFNDTIIVNNLYAGLSGTYTIGGDLPDFETIRQACAAIKQGGVAGDITFNIRDGIYSDTLTLRGPLPGLHCGHEIIFQSQSQDSNAVEINNLGLSNYPVFLKAAPGVTLRHLTIKTLTNTFPNSIHFLGGSHCLTIDHCSINGRPTTTETHAIIYSPSDQDTNILITNNRLFTGGSGVYLIGSANAYSDVDIRNNIIYNTKNAGIHLYRERKTLVEGNTIQHPDLNTGYGIRVRECNGFNRILANDIHLMQGRYGIVVFTCTGTSEVVNNMVKVQGTSQAHCIFVQSNDTINVFNNSASLHSTTTTINNNTTLFSQSNTRLTLFNNVFASFSTVGEAFRILTPLPFDIDHNIYHSSHSSGRIGEVNGTIINTLAQMQAATSKDQHSLVLNPQFLQNNTDLHTYLAVLNQAGDSLGILTDFDGDPRGNVHDIGADEFDPLPSDDAGVFMLISPNIPFTQGNQTVSFALKNFGGNAITSVVIHWTINGIEQPVYNWTGNLASTQCDTVEVGIFNFEDITAYTITGWTELPNGQADEYPDNDELTISQLYTTLNGVYTVGGFAPDFNVVADLQAALNTGGISGNVTFNFRPGTYQHAFQLKNFPRTSYNYSVIMTSESGDSTDVILTQLANNTTLIDFDDAHKVTFKKLSLTNTKGYICHIRNESSNINIEHCRLTGNVANTSNNSLIYSPNTVEDSITILNNVLHEGYYSIYLYGAVNEKNHLISGNTFTGSVQYCMYLRGTEDLTVTKNKLITTGTSNGDVYINSGTGKFTFSQNSILSDNSSYAVSISSMTNATVNPSLFINNFIYKQGTTSSDVVLLENISKINIDFNTISNQLSNTNSAALYTSGLTTYNVRNNVLHSFSGPAYQNVTGVPAINDYNDIFSIGAIEVINNSTNYPTHTAYATATNTNSNSISVDPLFQSSSPLPSQYLLNGSGIAIAGVTIDIDGTTRSAPPDMGAKEFTPLMNDIRISHVITPVSGCGLSSSAAVTVVLVNQGSNAAANVDISYLFNGVQVNENTGVNSVPAGDSLIFTFVQNINASAFGPAMLDVWISFPADQQHSNDSIHHNFTNHPPFTSPAGNLIPVNGTTGLENQVSLSWSPAAGAVKYDIYVWPVSGNKPVTPTKADVVNINTLVTGLVYGQAYYWMVHAINLCDQELPTDTATFSIRILPDLLVEDMIVPATAFSEQTIAIEWEVKNNGLGSTIPGSWYDNIYLSVDPTYNSFDVLLTSTTNLASLNPGQSYNHSANVTLPQGSNGLYYIIIKTDHYNGVKEVSDGNNTSFSSHTINVTLSPPPDLIVTQITTPILTFSGQNMNLTFRVNNIGSGITTQSIWKDKIALIPAPGNQLGISTTLLTKTHTGVLQPDSSYLVSATVSIQPNIFGDYRIQIITDERNDVFEFASEGNNVSESSTFEIVLTPPVDLIPDSLVIPSTISLYKPFTFYYHVDNEGGSAPPLGWTDRYYLSASPVFNPDFLVHLGYIYHAAGLLPDQSSYKSASVVLKENYSGTYYLYIVTDYNDQIDEFQFEGNNIIRSQPIQIIKPDLLVGAMQHPASSLSGTSVSVTTKMVNAGPGYYAGTVNNRYYLSTDPVLNTMTDILLTSKNFTSLIFEALDTVSKVLTVSIPDGLAGQYYLICHTDAALSIHETLDNNNILATPITLFEAPHVDIVPSQLVVPSSITAGVAFDISYLISNEGDVPMTTSAVDSIFISFSPSWNRATAYILGTRTTQVLDTQQMQSYTLNVSTLLTQNPNIYYLYIVSDARSAHFEGSGEANNILRSNSFVLNAYPDIDLMLNGLAGLTDTIVSGQLVNVQYTTTNLSSAPTYFSSWTDRVYLSVDSLYQVGSDMSIDDITYTSGTIEPAENQLVSAQVQIPHGISGDYYVFVDADAEDVNHDPVRNNNRTVFRVNGVARKIHIKLAPYPDLQPINFSAPVSVYAGQVFDIISTVTNAGPGNAASRADRFFVSSNAVIETGDYLLAGISQSGLPANQNEVDTMEVFVPANYAGNYYLIGSLDHLNQVYEYNGEGNNQVLATITALAPLPSDIIVQNILVPDSVLAGESATISWQTKNQGSNPATGKFREIVYLSPDTTWNLNDEVLGIWDGQATLSPGGTVTKSISYPYNNITNGNYHTLIRTDARNNFLESNENNNDGFSFDETNVDIKELFLHTYEDATLSASANLYYKLLITADEAGRNVLVTLKGDSLTGVNQIYAKYEAVPTQADHDYSYTEPFAGNQRIMLRDVIPGYYYFMINGYRIGNNTPQAIELLARIIRMEIIDWSPREGGNTGYTTMEIIGSELESLTDVKLLRADAAVYEEIIADTFLMFDEGTRVVARFNLKGKPLGMYHLQIRRDSFWVASARFGFEVIPGNGHDIQLNWQIQPGGYNPRFASIVQIKIDVENRGDSDAEGKLILVGTPNYNNPVYYSVNDYYQGLAHTQLVLPTEDLDGLEGILKPGGRRTYYVFGTISGLQGFSVSFDK